jgi:hypothetical protein
VKTGHLLPRGVRLVTDSTIIKSIEYPLLALTLTEKECDYIMAPILEVSLMKSHLHRRFQASEKGLGYNNIYTRQGMIQISKLNQHINDDNSITGKLMRNTIEIAKVEMGIGRNIPIDRVLDKACMEVYR